MKNYNIKAFLILAFFTIYGNNWAKVITVSSSGRYTSIQKAVAVAVDNDTIIIDGGIYKEGNIKIEKSIVLIGKNNPVLDGEYKNEIMTIFAHGVVVKNITFKNLAVDYIKDKAAIKLVYANNCIIDHNIVLDTYFGIYLEGADSSVISNNIIKGKATRESSSGNAIHLWQSNGNYILNNKVSGHRDGIYLEFVNQSRISGNRSTENLRYGLHFMFSNNNEYLNNEFIKNGAGVAVMYSKNILMANNKFQDSQGPAAYGILLKDITDSHIEKNIFSFNTIGILAEGSNRLDINNNNFLRNGYALKVMGSCESLILTGNNFIGNTFEISTNSKNISGHILEENFWSSYQGYDLDRDGIGDVPHKPVRLFSVLLEKLPSAVVLIGSLFVDLLELAEKLSPSLTPDQFADARPSMKINQWME